MKCVRFFLEHLTERVVILPTWLHGSIVDVSQTAVIFINNYFTPGQVITINYYLTGRLREDN